jgi:hypothetical protein
MKAQAASTWIAAAAANSAGDRGRQFPDCAEHEWCEGVSALRHRDRERDHARHVGAGKFDLGNQRRQPCAIAEADTEQHDTEQQ